MLVQPGEVGVGEGDYIEDWPCVVSGVKWSERAYSRVTDCGVSSPSMNYTGSPVSNEVKTNLRKQLRQ